MKKALIILLFVGLLFASGCTTEKISARYDGTLGFSADLTKSPQGREESSEVWVFYRDIEGSTQTYYLMNQNEEFIKYSEGSKLLDKASFGDKVRIYGTELPENLYEYSKLESLKYSRIKLFRVRELELIE